MSQGRSMDGKATRKHKYIAFEYYVAAWSYNRLGVVAG